MIVDRDGESDVVERVRRRRRAAERRGLIAAASIAALLATLTAGLLGYAVGRAHKSDRLRAAASAVRGSDTVSLRSSPDTLSATHTTLTAGAIAVFIGLAGFLALPSCDRCRALFGLRFVRSTVVRERLRYGLVTRAAYSSGSAWVPGQGSAPGRFAPVSSRTTWTERVPVIETKYSDLYRCRCGNEARHRRCETVEDFDRR